MLTSWKPKLIVVIRDLVLNISAYGNYYFFSFLPKMIKK